MMAMATIGAGDLLNRVPLPTTKFEDLKLKERSMEYQGAIRGRSEDKDTEQELRSKPKDI
jgi:hypothetical protein